MNRKIFKHAGRFALIVVIVVSLAASVSSFTQTDSRRPTIMLVVKSSESYFWQTVFQGARAAASEYNVQLEICAPQSEDDYQAQNQMLHSAVESGVDAIVFSACDYDRSVQAAEEAMDAGIPVISIDSPIHSDRVSVYIGTDNTAAGAQIAQELARLTHQKSVVGVVNCEEAGGVGIQREDGFLQELQNYPDMQVVEICYTSSNLEDPKEQTIQMLTEHPDIDAIGTFNEWTTLGVGAALEALGIQDEEIAVVGFDNNINSIAQMEQGVLDGLIVQNPFAMGYLGVERAISALKTKPVRETIVTETKLITAENMYNTENQKLLFPFFY